MFTIFGSTGNTGSVVARTLLAQGKRVRLLVRNASKVADLAALGATVIEGTLGDRGAVSEALRGAQGAYLLLPPDPSSTDARSQNRAIMESYAAGLREHGVKHVVLLSSIGAQLPSGTGPIVTVHDAERALSAIDGLTTTFVRAASFTENLLQYVHPMKADGVLPVYGGGETHPLQWVATHDIGRVAAEALLAPPVKSEVIELEGPRLYSFADAAAEASRILGRPVRAVPVPIETMVPTLTSFGTSPQFAELVREMTESFGRGAISFDGTGRAVRGTVTVGDVLRPALA